MKREESEGLVLRAIEYKQHQRILAVFTKDHGLIHLIVKGVNQKKSSLLSLTMPFSVGEFYYTIHRSELYCLRDASLKNAHFELRENLRFLDAAGKLCKALLASQLPAKSAPLLYQLILCYFQQIPFFKDPYTLVASFLLKLLKHEGFLLTHLRCTYCQNLPTHLALGEPLCSLHTSPLAHRMAKEEWELLYTLAETNRFSILKQISLQPSFRKKIEQSFQERYPTSKTYPLAK